jgi:hypothetical protein
MLLLDGASFAEVLRDISILTLTALAILTIGAIAFVAALRHARRTGTLSQY